MIGSVLEQSSHLCGFYKREMDHSQMNRQFLQCKKEKERYMLSYMQVYNFHDDKIKKLASDALLQLNYVAKSVKSEIIINELLEKHSGMVRQC